MRPSLLVAERYLRSREAFENQRSPTGGQLSRLEDGTESVSGGGASAVEERLMRHTRWTALWAMMGPLEQKVAAMLVLPLEHTVECRNGAARCSCGAVTYHEKEIWVGDIRDLEYVRVPTDADGNPVPNRVVVLIVRVERPTYEQVAQRIGMARHMVNEVLKRADRRYLNDDTALLKMKGGR